MTQAAVAWRYDVAQPTVSEYTRAYELYRTFDNDLPKHFYVLALSAPDPSAALALAADRKAAGPAYSVRAFKRDLVGVPLGAGGGGRGGLAAPSPCRLGCR